MNKHAAVKIFGTHSASPPRRLQPPAAHKTPGVASGAPRRPRPPPPPRKCGASAVGAAGSAPRYAEAVRLASQRHRQTRERMQSVIRPGRPVDNTASFGYGTARESTYRRGYRRWRRRFLFKEKISMFLLLLI